MVDNLDPTLAVNQDSLHKQVAALPEIYQPIFDHPELSMRVTRTCEDRLVHITKIYKTLEEKLGRPLRVLDLGCAQGFFSLSLAKQGGIVEGIELQECNISVCQTLASEHPEWKVRFKKGLIEEVIMNLKPDQYDLVLGLSVFHHLVHISGVAVVQQMIAVLAQNITAGIYELSLPNEPTVRAPTQLENPRLLLNGYAFVHEVAKHPTHLPGIYRPLYITSNRYWFLNDQADQFDTWKIGSHELTSNKSRRYFFGNGFVTKIFHLDEGEFHEINRQEYTNETSFLKNPPPDIKTPKLLLEGQNQSEVWIVREQMPGELLLDRMRFQKIYDAKTIIQDILKQLTAFESIGLYHNDLRTWNILVEPDGHATLIDYGAITPEAKDRGWPYNVFLSFMIFLNEIITGVPAIPDPIRPVSFNPDNFPEPYRSMLWKLFEYAPDEWRFTLLQKSSSSQEDLEISPSTRQSFAKILETMNDACKIHEKSTIYWRRRAG